MIMYLYEIAKYKGDFMTSVLVKSRSGEIQGKRNQEIAFFDCFDRRANKMIRHFILLNYGVQLRYEPFGWNNEWYIDFIEIDSQPSDTMTLKDVYLDIVVEGMGPTYRIIDAEELADAFEESHIQAGDLCQILRNLQIFVDDHLHRNIDNFPPKSILPYFG